jgi:hypothetical protein
VPVTVEEKFESRRKTAGQSPNAELRYTVRGTDDDDAAMAAVQATAPPFFDYLWRETVSIEPVGPQLWEGIVRYGVIPATAESEFAFETGGGTQHITQSLATGNRYAQPGKTAPDFKGAVGVTADSVEGVDITIPVYHFSETHYLPGEFVTNAYKGILFGLTGRVNSAPFKGLAAGECLFLGASGSKRGGGDWQITYRFAANPNVAELTVGDITGINKEGWQYLWVRYADAEDSAAKTLVKRPVAVYVEKVYEYGDLSLLGIGT